MILISLNKKPISLVFIGDIGCSYILYDKKNNHSLFPLHLFL